MKTDPAALRKALETRRSQLDRDFETFRSHYKELSDHILPWHGRGLSGESEQENVDGAKKSNLIIDPTATHAVNVLSAGLQSGLTSPARPWFRMGFPDPELRDYPPVKAWLFYVEDALRYIMARSNLYNCLHHCYMELGVFGTAAMAIMEDMRTVVRGRAFTAGEFRLGQDADGRVDTFYRTIWMTARQLVDTFGKDNVCLAARNAYEQNNFQTLFAVYQAIEPNDDVVAVREARKKPWRSVYYEKGAKGEKMDTILRSAGYDEFPVMAPRWHVVGQSTYGYGPGMIALPDVKMLQKMQTKGLVALDKMVDPPVVGPASLKNVQVNTMPGGLTAVDEMGGQGGGVRSMYDVRMPLDALEIKIARTQEMIQKGFFNDLFLMLASQPLSGSKMTATEVMERHEEKMLMLGPVLERLHSELLDPLVDRVFNIAVRMELIPPAPPEVRGQEMAVEYISLLAQAQKMSNATAIHQFAGFVGNLAAVNPGVLDKFDMDEAVDVYADIVGVPPKLVKSEEDVATMRQAKAEEAQRQRQMEMFAAAGPTMVQGAKVLSDTQLSENTALTQLMNSART